jgi:ComF family protein
MLGTISRGLLELLYPNECPGCGVRTEQSLVCRSCFSSFRDADRTILTAETPASTDHPIALWIFEENAPVQKVMHQIKYGNRPWLGERVGFLLGQKLLSINDPEISAVVVPVPLHPSRRFGRGYNQSEWIARGVARRLALPISKDALVRSRETRSQTTLSREERLDNVSDAFGTTTACLDGRIVILVDDTLTTGATLFACAKVLVHAGADRVVPCAAATAPLRAAMEPGVAIPVIAA